ncbi:PREDICTED: protein PYRICULARIA ORYZAE RESISTANCE 21-like isoform X2 [Ipomoea nil]|uniref:protein PYRICULARIA ORYZAE RESISTANCE 21-like isoform X2 n=1 Tax=Ipomoea nil TaxID=35883 RepID=UPI0009016782|nr:PREDICTED: protein PYRICULARIA ORYZAE RESISTANCE 21-like isoform X2 [Ipomoea nil]
MAPEKTTVMFLSVDLKCSSCYKKVKKVICKIPQIRDQIYNEEENKVRITVVCCSPEKIRDKLCYKGGGVIKSIEIVDPPKPPKPAEKPKEAPKADKPKEAPKADKPKDAPKADKPKDAPKADKPKEAPKADKPKDAPKPEADKPKDAKKSEKPKGPPAPEGVPVPMKQPEPISNVPAPGQVTMMSVTHGFPPPMYCYEPSYEWYGTPVAPPPPLPPPRPCYDSYPNWCRCGQARGYYGGCRCDNTYFSEENESGCTIM